MKAIISPMKLNIAQAELDDLTDRLERIRWPSSPPVEGAQQGPTLENLQALVTHWRTAYDWRRCEHMLNSLGQSLTSIDGIDIHFLHIRSKHQNAMPLLLTHGWPGSVLEFRHIIDPLVNPTAHGGIEQDAFHLVIPSMPGFGFSGKPTEPGWHVGRIAQAWVELMARLEYDHWGAKGGDWGALVTQTLAQMDPPGLVGIHLNFVPFQPTEQEVTRATKEEQKMLADAKRYHSEYAAYMNLMSTRPQSVAFALSDSPVGLAAWIYALFQDVSDSDRHPESVFSLDEMLDDIMLYWLPNAGPTSARLYWESMQAMRDRPETSGKVQTPTGISMFPAEQVRLSEQWANNRFEKLVHFAEHSRGGHFAAMEAPESLVADIRQTFLTLR